MPFEKLTHGNPQILKNEGKVLWDMPQTPQRQGLNEGLRSGALLEETANRDSPYFEATKMSARRARVWVQVLSEGERELGLLDLPHGLQTLNTK